MKWTAAAAVLAPAAVVNAQPWFAGAPECAQSCLSSAWATTSSWPAPSDFCGASATPVASCISAGCGTTSSAGLSTFSSVSSSLCSQYSSCSASGSTGVTTITASGAWGPGGFGGPGGPRGTGTGNFVATRTYGPGVFTVTGCPWSGSPWFGGPGAGWGGWGNGWSGPWGPWSTASGGASTWCPGWASASGWTYQTQTAVVTTTVTSAGSVVTTTGVATVAQAVSGSVTQTTTLFGAAVTGSSNAGAGQNDDLRSAKVVGALLGGVVAVAGML